MSDDTNQTILDRYGADATTDTDNFLRPYTTVPVASPGADIKKRTDLLVDEWFKKYLHQYTAEAEFKKNREAVEARLLASLQAQQTSGYVEVAYSGDYRTDPLSTRED